MQAAIQQRGPADPPPDGQQEDPFLPPVPQDTPVHKPGRCHGASEPQPEHGPRHLRQPGPAARPASSGGP
ncbi:hypothetical protein ACOMHN_007951 [Nucella lapillus]